MKKMFIHFNRGWTGRFTTPENKFTSSQKIANTISVANTWSNKASQTTLSNAWSNKASQTALSNAWSNKATVLSNAGSNKASQTALSNAWSPSTTSSILLAIILAVTHLASQCEGHAGGARRLPDDVPPMDYDGVGARPPRVRVVQRVTPTSRVVPQLEDPSTDLQNSTNFSHSEPFVPILYKPWWSPEQDQTTSDDEDESDNTVRKYIESGNMPPRNYDESGGNIVRKYGNTGGGHSALNNRAIFDSPYRGRGSGGSGRLNPFWQQLPDDLPSYPAETDNEQEYGFEPAAEQQERVDEPAAKKPVVDNPANLEPYFEPENFIHCYICNQSSSTSSHNKINKDYCNLQRGLLTSCARGFNICLQYCDARSGATVRACGRSHRKRNDWNCRMLRETLPTLAHCSECSHAACNTGMNCRLDAPYHVSQPPTYMPPPPLVQQFEANLNRRRTFHRLQPRGANFIESPTHPPPHSARHKNNSIEIQPGPTGSDQFSNANSDQTHSSSETNTHDGPFDKYQQQHIEAEAPDLDNKKQETNDESTTDLEQFIGGHTTHNEDQQHFIGGQIIHNQSEDSIVMNATNRSPSQNLTNKESPLNIEEDGGSLGTGSTNDGSTIQGCTQSSDLFASLSASTLLTESSKPQPSSPGGAIGPQSSSSGGTIGPQPSSSGGTIGPQPSCSGGTIETPTSSSVHLDLHIELPVSSSSSSLRPIELEYAEFDPEAYRELIENHKFVYTSLSVSNDEKGTMLMYWCAAAMLLIL